MSRSAKPVTLQPLREFVTNMTALVTKLAPYSPELASFSEPLLSKLVAIDNWLPDQYARSHPEHYQQYLLYCDPLQRFSVVSFVWEPGQATPVHDHQTWGVVGVLRGSEGSQTFQPDESGNLVTGDEVILGPGETETLPGNVVHVVRNAHDNVSVSIHVYGGNIGAIRRNVFLENGATREFISGYVNDTLPNIWACDA